MKSKSSRRSFLHQASCAGMGYFTFANTIMNLKALKAASISNSAVASASDYKAIVCVLLAGGNDSFNMLVPYDTTEHGYYVDARNGLYTDGGPGLALPRNMLQNTVLNYSEGDREWALHPTMQGVKNHFDTGRAAMLANVGTLARPTTVQDYDNDFRLPLGLFSHSDQIEEWQTSLPDIRSAKGWGGKMADLINDCNSNDNISMNISLNGSNIWQRGNGIVEYAIDGSGVAGISEYERESTNFFERVRTEAIDGLLAQEYSNVFDRTFNNVTKSAVDGFIEFDEKLQNAATFPTGTFPDSDFGASLEMIARIMSIRDDLGFKRQTFFVNVGGWDHHDEVIDRQAGMLGGVSAGISAFQDVLGTGAGNLNIEDDVLTIFISEFGRTLSSNGNGSDHGWGGNTMVLGGPNLIDGGKLYGNYPSLSLSNPDPNFIEKRGRFVPSLSTDEYFAEIARWFGVPNTDLPLIFPNIGEFYDVSSSNNPIGFIKA